MIVVNGESMSNKQLLILKWLAATTFLLNEAGTHCDLNGNENHIRQEPDINFPGPDFANFPNSPFTLPRGRSYVENYFISANFAGNNNPFQYNWPFLLRFGITDSLELRLTGQGFTYVAAINQTARIVGFSPLIFDCKIHFWGKPEDFWVPSVGLELAILTPLASPALKSGIQFIATALFDHEFPHNFSFEWNAAIGLSHLKKYSKSNNLFVTIKWAAAKDITPKHSVSFQGMYDSKKLHISPQQLLLGLGWQSIVTKRLAVYGNFNWSLFHTINPYLLNIGFTVAF